MLRLPASGGPNTTSSVDDREAAADSYRRLAEIFHAVLAEESLDSLLRRIADTLADLVAYDALTVLWADETKRLLVPVLARDPHAEAILATSFEFGTGVTGHALEQREPVRVARLHDDPRSIPIPGTPPDEPEALVSVPLIARGRVKGALNVYRLGESVDFSDGEFELLARFGDAVALALDNAEIRLRLEHQAQTDSLTGLYNHRAFHERLRAELARTSRTGGSVAVLMLDIDDFKRVNDIHGHAAGDLVLVGLARLLRRTARTADVVCRIGGEEFAAVLPDTDAEHAVPLAHRIAQELAASSFGPVGRVTASIGIAHAPEHAMSARELTSCAEAAMMTGKTQGKSQIVVFADERAPRDPGDPRTGRDARSLAHLKLLQSLVGRLNRLNRMEDIGEVIVDELATLIDYHDCRVYIRDGDDLLPVAFRGELGVDGEDAARVLRCRVGQGVTGRAAELGGSLLIGDALACEFAVQIPGTDAIEESMVATPLLYSGRVIGVIVLSKLGLDQFDEHDVRLLEVLAGHAAVALENARLFAEACNEAERLERTLLSTIEAIASALEARGGHASTHPRELARLVVRVGEAHGIDGERRRRLALAALLHDIGTIGFPSAILAKEGPLTPEERSILELHPELGERILASVEELGEVRSIVRHCHERWDGSGYPDELAFDAIPLEARIVLVCDAYLAMTSKRPYRAPLVVEEAKDELRRGAGTQFDPAVVETLLGLV